MVKSFASDNNSNVHDEILRKLTEANIGHYISYGDDKYTQKAKLLFKETFGSNTEVFFVLTGTGANVCALQAITDRYNAIICPETAHINIDECGAAEHVLGTKLLDVATSNGKLTNENIEEYLHFIADEHHVQPKIISITQATELGTVYTIEELKNLVNFAKKQQFKVHMDGARLCNAAVTLNCSLKELTTDIGIDVLSFGGTKNGMMIGEAVVFFYPEDIKYFPFIRKQNMQLISKMRYIAAQYIPYLSSNLWYTNAKQANDMALYLYEKLKSTLPEILTAKPESNALFVKLPNDIAIKMQKERFFYAWDIKQNLYRFMTSYDMESADIDDFVKFLIKYLRR